MNKRKLVDYTSMYEALATLMKTELPEVELYFAIGWAVCVRPEKGAAVMAAEHLQASCPESKGFSPRNLRRMREFYRATQIAGAAGAGPKAGLDAERGHSGGL